VRWQAAVAISAARLLSRGWPARGRRYFQRRCRQHRGRCPRTLGWAWRAWIAGIALVVVQQAIETEKSR